MAKSAGVLNPPVAIKVTSWFPVSSRRLLARAIALAPDIGYGYRYRAALYLKWDWQKDRAGLVLSRRFERAGLVAYTGYGFARLFPELY